MFPIYCGFQVWWIGGKRFKTTGFTSHWMWVDSYGASSGVDIKQEWVSFMDNTRGTDCCDMVIGNTTLKMFAFSGVARGYICEQKTMSPGI